MKKTTLQFLDHIDQPVFVVGFDGAVINSNPQALNCLARAAGLRDLLGELARDAAVRPQHAFPVALRMDAAESAGLERVTLFRMNSYLLMLATAMDEEKAQNRHAARLDALDVLAREVRDPVIELLGHARDLARRAVQAGGAGNGNEQRLAHLDEKIAAFSTLHGLLEQMGPESLNEDSRIDAAALIEQTMSTCRPLAQQRGIQLTAQIATAGLPVLYGPVRWIEEVLRSFVLDALQRTQRGDGLVVHTRHISGFLYFRFEAVPADAAKPPPIVTVKPPVFASLGKEIARWAITLIGGAVSGGGGEVADLVLQVPLAPPQRAGCDADQAQFTRFAEEIEALMGMQAAPALIE